jgi:hypothetical protein
MMVGSKKKIGNLFEVVVEYGGMVLPTILPLRPAPVGNR